MKYTVAAVVAFAGLVAAQADVPECALPCLTAAVEKIGCTALDDVACSCTPENQAKLASDAEMITCLTTGCQGDDFGKAIAAGTAICAAAGDGSDSGADDSGNDAGDDSGDDSTGDDSSDDSTGADSTSGADTSGTPTSDSSSTGASESSPTSSPEGTTTEVPTGAANTNAFFGAAAFVAALFAL